MQQGKMFFIMGLCMALVQGGYVRRIPHGKELSAAMSVSKNNSWLSDYEMRLRSLTPPCMDKRTS